RTTEAAELLPPDAREFLDSQVALREPASAQLVQEAATAPLADLTINLLGHVEIFRDPKRPFAADAWTTRRAHDILCFIATAPHPLLAPYPAQSPRLQRHDYRHFLGRGGFRHRGQEFSPDSVAHSQGAQQQSTAQTKLFALS